MPDLPPPVPHRKRPRRQKTAERGYGHEHQKQRAALIAQHPLCQRCQTDWSHHLHHRDRDPFNRDPANVEIICRACHQQEHGGHC